MNKIFFFQSSVFFYFFWGILRLLRAPAATGKLREGDAGEKREQQPQLRDCTDG